MPGGRPSFITWWSFSSAAPAMIGVESRKLKRAAASRVKLRNKPPVIVIPERETPGITANACNTPDGHGVSQRDLRQRLQEPADCAPPPT